MVVSSTKPPYIYAWSPPGESRGSSQADSGAHQDTTRRRYTVVWYYLSPRFENPSIEKLGSVAFIGAARADCGFVLIISGSVECWRLLILIRGSVDWSKKCAKMSIGCWYPWSVVLGGNGSVDVATVRILYMEGHSILFILNQGVNSFCV